MHKLNKLKIIENKRAIMYRFLCFSEIDGMFQVFSVVSTIFLLQQLQGKNVKFC